MTGLPQAERQALEKKCDTLFSILIRERDDYQCRVCGRDGRESKFWMHCAHIVSRKYSATRWHEGNAVTLCQKDHEWFGRHPEAWRHWIDEQFGKDYYAGLEAVAHQAQVPDLRDVRASLRQGHYVPPVLAVAA